MAKRKRRYEYHSPESEAKAKSNLRQNKTRTMAEIKREVREFRSKKKKLKDLNIIEFCEGYLNISFKGRPCQKTILKIFYGLKLSDQELDLYKKLTPNEEIFEPETEKTEGLFVLGAKAGKSFIVSLIALYECVCRGNYWKQFLNRGETGYCIVVSVKEKLATEIIQAYCARIMQYSKISYLVKRSYQNELEFQNGLKIYSISTTSRSGLGLNAFLILYDEIGHFFVEGAKADIEIYNSLRPRQLSFKGAKSLLISTPAGKQGLLFSLYEQGFKVKDRLTCQGESLLINPLVDQEFLRKELERDPDFYKMEYLAEFCEKAEAYLPLELIKSVEKYAGDLRYKSEYSYQGAIDQSGLAKRDKFGFSLTHKDRDGQVYVDIARSWRVSALDLDNILGYIRELAGKFKVKKLLVDRFAKGYIEASLAKIGLETEIRPSLAEIYSNFKSLAIMQKLNIPMLKELREGLLNTQSYFSKSNTMSIAHEKTLLEGHSDLADAVLSSIFASSKEREKRLGMVYTGEDLQEEESIQEFVDKSINEISERRRGWDRFLD